MLHSSIRHAIGLVSCILSLGSCSSTGKVDAWAKATGNRTESLKIATSLSGIRVPILKAEGLERVWGKPEIKTDPSGGYLLTYSDPKHSFTRLMIHGMSTPLPKLSSPPILSGEEMVHDQLTGFQRPQEWQQLVIAGQKVRWYQESTSGGADGAYYSTEGFTLKTADDKTGYYRLVAEAGDDTDPVARWFRSVSF